MKNAILFFAGLTAAAWLFYLYDVLARWWNRRTQHDRA